jgi:hypothetical protein
MSHGQQQTHGVDHGIAGAISRELHQTAQPLTTLQGLLELSLQRAQTVQQYRDSVTKSIEQLQRLLDSFGRIRHLVRLQCSGNPSSFKVRSLIDAVSQDLQSKLDASGVRLAVHSAAGATEDLWEEEVAGSLSEPVSAISLIISGFLTFLRSGDCLEISFDKDQTHVLIRVHSSWTPDLSNTAANAATGSMAAHLRLAQDLISGTRGKLKVCYPPSTIFIRLPRVPAMLLAGLEEKGIAQHV